MRFRPGTEADLPALQRLVLAAFSDYMAGIGQDWSENADWLGERIAAGKAVVAEHPTGALAGVMFRTLDPEAARMTIDLVAVAPEAQGKGAGRAIIAEGERIARSAGARLLCLHTVAKYARLVRFYEDAGFRIVGFGPRRSGDDGHLRAYFEKPLIP